jgi:hypothetical protein
MKHLVTLLTLILFCSTAFGQFPKDEETGKVVYTEVVELPGMDKKAIYDKAKLWIVSTLKSGDNMVELEGSNSDQIVGTGNVLLDSIKLHSKKNMKYLSSDASLNFKFLVHCKDGKLKYSIENFLLSTFHVSYKRCTLSELKPFYPTGNDKDMELWRENTSEYIDRHIQKLIDDFTNSMVKSPDENW